MRALHISSEIFPLLKTGGLADVAAALPAAQVRLGCDTRVLVPGFPALVAGVADQVLVAQLASPFGPVSLYRGAMPDSAVGVYVICAAELYDRPGNPYSDASHREYADNHRRFALLGWVGAQLAQGLDPAWTPSVVHCHDWHAGLAPAYLRAAREAGARALPASVITVHNLAYQGVFPPEVFPELGLPASMFGVDGVEFWGQVSFLKAGLQFADKITTVSPTYAREIQGAEQGCGLDGLLRARAGDLAGILNGVDDAVWNPATDPLLPAPFAANALHGKSQCKAALQAACGLAPDPGALLFCVVSRLTEQKGLHLVLASLPAIIARGGQLALLGSGERHIEEAFAAAARAHPESVSVRIGYDEAYAHTLIGASDVIFVPSRFEPCGLTQLYGLKYGTLPLVRRVGGLADTVCDSTLENLDDDSATGFVFHDFSVAGLDAALRRAFVLHSRPASWLQVQLRAMQQQFGWEAPAADYLTLYQNIQYVP
ncbi:MAG: glycogen synthase GlgA [Pseudomonadota bacterium]